MRRTLAWLCLGGLSACTPDGRVIDDYMHYSEGFAELQRWRPRKVDILIVLDNSSSMAEEQALLANSLGPMIEVLEDESVRADYRIAITTTDAGHPACPTSTPERGAFMLTPCTGRLDEFIADGEGGPSDVRALACNDICQLSAAELEILPTATDEDPTPAPRPWLERSRSHTNLLEGADMADALRCFAPQGVAGCDFESPLESMYQALLRAKDANDPAYGFLRKDAWLMVVIITDEDDCSVAPGGEDIFADGDATSAACWNAGVTCAGDPSNYESCEANVDAILRPPSRYVELFDAIMADKRALDPEVQPFVQIVGGATSNGGLYFADVGDTDPEFQQTFGIGPGCIANSGDPDRPIRATPPVRLQATQAAVGLGDMLSVCEGGWEVALGPIAWWSGPQIRPACFPHCAVDTDFSTLTLEPDCIVEEESFDGSSRHIEECERDEQGYRIDPETNDYQLPPGVDVCYAELSDSGLWTPSPHDDMSPECSDRNMSLEFKIARRPGHWPASSARVTATCLLSNHPSVACPELEE